MARPHEHPKTGVYYFRRVVPTGLRAIVGKVEWKWSLHTKDRAEAKARFVKAAAKCDEMQRQAERGIGPQAATLTAEQAIALGAEWLKRKLASVPDEDIAAWVNPEAGIQEALDDLRHASERGAWFAKIKVELERLLKAEGLKVDPGSPTYERLGRVLFERLREFYIILLWRAGGPEDTVGAIKREHEALLGAPAWKKPIDRSKTVGWALDGWQAENKLRPKSAYEQRRALEHFGIDRALAEVTPSDVVEFKDRWVSAGQAPDTINKKLSALRSVFGWAKGNHHIPADPTLGIKTGGLTKSRHENKRIGYTIDEAGALLMASRSEAQTIRWMTWMLAATGCRIQEVAQAFATDVRQVGSIWYLNVTNEGEGQRLKNKRAKRMVPLHPLLISEGVVSYAKALPVGSRLFPDIKPDRWGGYGGNIDDDWNKWAKCIIPGKSAHCFRHAFKTAARNAGIPEDVHDYITGHSGGGPGRGYGTNELPMLAAAIAKIDFGAP